MIFKYQRKQKYENFESVVSSSTAKYGEEMKKISIKLFFLFSIK
jgi:hypothetical protein